MESPELQKNIISTQAISESFTLLNFQNSGTFNSGTTCVYKMKSANSSFLVQILPISLTFADIKLNPTEYYSLVLICQLIGATEGPLYSRIRGEGLAYRVNMTTAIFSRQIIFSIGESVDPWNCLKTFHSLIEEIRSNPMSWFNEKSLSSAKSCLIYQIQENRNTPSGILSDKFKDLLSNYAFNSNYQTILKIVQPKDLIEAFSKYFLSFLDPKKPLTLAVGPEKMVQCSGVNILTSLKEYYF